MNDNEKYIEKYVKDIPFNSPDNEHRDELKKQLLKSFPKHRLHSQKTTSNIRKIIRKNNITRIAAAAVIIVGLMLFSYFNNGKFEIVNSSFAKMTENMKKMPWLHAVIEGTDDGETNHLEGWVSFEFQIFITKSSSGEILFYNKGLREQYDPESNMIETSQSTVTELENANSVLEYWENMTEELSKDNTKIISNNQGAGKRTTVYKIDLSKDGESIAEMELKLIVDTDKNLPTFFYCKNYDTNGDLVSEIHANFDYPQTGPKDIYELGVSREAKIEELKPKVLLKGHLIDKNGDAIEGIVTSRYGDIQTDKNGEFLISTDLKRDIGLTDTHISFAFNKDKKLSRGFLWKYEGEPETVELVLESRATIQGRVVNNKGIGLGDVKPTIYVLLGEGSSGGTSGKEWKTVINKNGEFKFEGVPIGLSMRVFVEKPGYQGWIDLPELKAGEAFDAGDLILKALSGYDEKTDWTGILKGIVTNENGEPMSGLRMNTQPGGELIETKTDKKGQYTLKGLPKGKRIWGSIYAAGYGHTSFNTIVDGNELDIQLFPQGWSLLNKKAPGLFVEKWLNTEPIEPEQYQGKVVLLQLGVYLPNYLYYYEHLEKIIKKYDPEDIEVIIVHTRLYNENNVTENDIIDFIKKHNISYPFGIDDSSDKVRDLNPPRLIGNGAMYSLYDVKATPALYLVDKKGILRISPTEKELDKWIKKLIKE